MNSIEGYLKKYQFDQECVEGVLKGLRELPVSEKIRDKYAQLLMDNYDNILKLRENRDTEMKGLPLHFFDTTLSRVNDDFCRIMGHMFPQYDFFMESNGIMGPYDEEKVNKIVETLNQDGYYIYDELLNEEACNRILEACQKVEFKFQKDTSRTTIGIDLDNHGASTYWALNQYDIAAIDEVQALITDPIILDISQKYLQRCPVNIQTNLWWSVAGKTDQTQYFHQDFEDVKFLKVFIYLSDVTEKTGAHTYVAGSRHNFITPPNYKTSMRVGDDFIRNKYGADKVKVFTGQKGTIIFEDTNGYHKGAPLLEGHRIILQLEFGVSTRGLMVNIKNKQREKMTFKVNPDFMEKYPDTYIKYL